MLPRLRSGRSSRARRSTRAALRRLTSLAAAIAALAIAATMPAAAQRKEPLTAVRVRSFAREAESRAKGDPNELILALDKRVRDTWGNFESFPISIVRREDLTVTLTTPFMGYRRALAEYLRMRRPIAETPWLDAAIVSVGLNRVDAPDIVNVTVERDGKPVAPLANGLKPMSFQNGNGQSAVLHAGDVTFPMSAFAPGGTVTVTAIPAAGERFAITLDGTQLEELK